MDVFLTAASNPFWVFIIFLVLLVVLHVILVFLFPLSVKRRILVDYVWVILTLISLLGLVDEARRYKAEMKIAPAQERVEDNLQAVTGWFENYQVFACEDQAANQDYAALCNWISRKRSDVEFILAEEAAPAAIPQALIDEVAATQLLPEQERNLAAGILTDYADSRVAYLVAVQEAERSPLRQLMVVFAPIFFAAALALIMTKVTAEYRAAKG